jgi:hypothetical protein
VIFSASPQAWQRPDKGLMPGLADDIQRASALARERALTPTAYHPNRMPGPVLARVICVTRGATPAPEAPCLQYASKRQADHDDGAN